jgi:hypothetical protein
VIGSNPISPTRQEDQQSRSPWLVNGPIPAKADIAHHYYLFDIYMFRLPETISDPCYRFLDTPVGAFIGGLAIGGVAGFGLGEIMAFHDPHALPPSEAAAICGSYVGGARLSRKLKSSSTD